MPQDFKLITHLTNAFAPLPNAAIEIALVGEPTRERHDLALHAIPAFEALEYQLPRNLPALRKTGAFRASVFSWNAERLKYARPSQALLGSVLPDIALLTEVDIGMARSGNRHTVRDLAEPLDSGYVYGGKGNILFSNLSDVFNNIFQITSDINNNSDIIMITTQSFGSSTPSVVASLSWQEIHH